MTTDELPFPLWVLVSRDEYPWKPVMLTPGLATAFSSHKHAANFLQETSNPVWEVRLVVRVTWAVVMENFSQQGASGLVLDPDTNGRGTQVAFGETDKP